jgi:hypothetical protein
VKGAMTPFTGALIKSSYPVNRALSAKIMKKRHFIFAFDIVSKLLLAWFVFQTLLYFYTGRFSVQIGHLKHFGSESILMDIYTLIQIPVSGVGAIILIPLILKGHKSGLFLGILYWIMGYIINPLWYVFPRTMQVTASREPALLLIILNILWSAITVLLMTAYYFYRRSLRLKTLSNKQSDTSE